MKTIELTLSFKNKNFKLDNNITSEELYLFFEALLFENDLKKTNITKEIKRLIKEKRLCYPGEITFIDENKMITTGCCFCLNDFKNLYFNIKNNEDTWLGHDPDVIIEYEGNNVAFFTYEDYESIKISYKKEELLSLLNEVNIVLEQFSEKLYKFFEDNYPNISNLIYNDLKERIILKVPENNSDMV